VTNLITPRAVFYYIPIEFGLTGNSAIRSADPDNSSLEPNTEWIGYTVCEIFALKLYCDLETGVWVTQGHRKRQYSLQQNVRMTLYSSSIVNMLRSITVFEI